MPRPDQRRYTPTMQVAVVRERPLQRELHERSCKSLAPYTYLSGPSYKSSLDYAVAPLRGAHSACHPERSEESLAHARIPHSWEIPRRTRDDEWFDTSSPQETA